MIAIIHYRSRPGERLASVMKKILKWLRWFFSFEELGTAAPAPKTKGESFFKWLLASEPLEQSSVVSPAQDGFFRWLFKKESL